MSRFLRMWSGRIVLAGLMALVMTGVAQANINLEWRPLSQTVYVGDSVGVGLYAVSDNDQDQNFNSAQVIITWDPAYLDLTGVDQSGSVGLQISGFLSPDSFGLNESNPPADGDGIWFGLVQTGQVRYATPTGSLLTTVMFDALAETPGTYVAMLPDMQKEGYPRAYTKVIQGTYNVVGTLSDPAAVIIIPEPASLAFLVMGALIVLRSRK